MHASRAASRTASRTASLEDSRIASLSRAAAAARIVGLLSLLVATPQASAQWTVESPTPTVLEIRG